MTVHLDYDEPTLGYHRVVAGLAAARAGGSAAVADIGCGPGQLLAELHRLRPDLRLTGIDGDEECLRRAKNRCSQAEFQLDDIADLGGLPAGQRFDLITSSHALEHVANPVATLQLWASRLNPSGLLIIAVPNALTPPLIARALVRRPWANEGHYYIWDRPTFENFCRLAGFRMLDNAIDYVPLLPVAWRQRLPLVEKAEHGLNRLMPYFTNSHIVTLALPDSDGS